MMTPHTTDPSTPTVHFEGRWSDAERTLIERAAVEVETATLPSMPGARHAPWVATCHDRGTSAVYAASRHGISRVVSARSAQVLAEKIRALELGGRKKEPASPVDVLEG